MNHKKNIIIALLAMPLGFFSCSKDDETTTPEPETLVVVDPKLEQALDQQFPLGFKYNLQNNELTFVKVFDSYTNEAVERDLFDRNDADAMAQKFVDLIPYNIRKETAFLYLTGSRPNGENFEGFVESINTNDNTHWLVALGIGSYIFADESTREENLIGTMIHEFAHIKSANSEQASRNVSNCGQNELDSGQECFKSDSYMVNFYNTFWEDILEEWTEDSEAYYNAHQEDFVTGYASSNYSEDFAESFRVFVVEDAMSTGNTKADQKVNFFYQFDYWKSIRLAIRENL
jgi:hypothetical protein